MHTSTLTPCTPQRPRLTTHTAHRPIEQLAVDDEVAGGGFIVATMQFARPKGDMFHLGGGVEVAGDHAVRIDGVWSRARDAVGAVRVRDRVARGGGSAPTRQLVYDLITEKHRIVVAGKQGDLTFADYEETDDTPEDEARFLVELAAQDQKNAALAAAAAATAGPADDSLRSGVVHLVPSEPPVAGSAAGSDANFSSDSCSELQPPAHDERL